MTLSIVLRVLALVQAALARCADNLTRTSEYNVARANDLLDRAQEQHEDAERASRIATRISDLTA